MTGPARGKLPLKSEVYFLSKDAKLRLPKVAVYIHLKGYARARVTHLDIESRTVTKLIRRGLGNFLELKGIEGGIAIKAREEREVEVGKNRINLSGLLVQNPLLNEVLAPGEVTRTWVGRKFDGIYVGFRRNEISKLEKVALERFGMKPLTHLAESPSGVRR